MRYQFQAQTDCGDPEYRLGVEPLGWVNDPKGLLICPAPADFADSEVNVTVHAKNSADAETSQSFRIGITKSMYAPMKEVQCPADPTI